MRACANRERSRWKIPVLKQDRSLDRAARRHARAMLEQGFFGHVDPHGRGPTERVARVSHRRWAVVGENLAAGYADATETCARWDRDHRTNMLKRGYTHIGAGYAEGPRGYRRYYVQVFARLTR